MDAALLPQLVEKSGLDLALVWPRSGPGVAQLLCGIQWQTRVKEKLSRLGVLSTNSTAPL